MSYNYQSQGQAQPNYTAAGYAPATGYAAATGYAPAAQATNQQASSYAAASSAAQGYTPNVEFQLNMQEPPAGTANRDAIVAEQQRILTVFNDWLIAQKLRVLGQATARMPQIANEQTNKAQLETIIKEAATMNVDRANMSGVMNNFGQQYCRFITERDAVENQRQLNEIEKARMQGTDFLPTAAQRYLHVCQAGVILSVGGTFGALIAFWTGATAVGINLQAAKTAGIQLIVVGLLQFICLGMRIAVLVDVTQYKIPRASYGKDQVFISRLWDFYIASILITIISFGAWMWTKSNAKFGHGKGDDFNDPEFVGAAAAAAAAAATATASNMVLDKIPGVKTMIPYLTGFRALETGPDIVYVTKTIGEEELATKVADAAAATFFTATGDWKA
ncbi:hypothetical protein TWF718_002195 [Orbilia javanica]|uniref:Uncharacterized protein n=1 Tax=Orbilia javanica TaxID=47235 RepID=A0AAN8MH16_9PEZI